MSPQPSNDLLCQSKTKDIQFTVVEIYFLGRKQTNKNVTTNNCLCRVSDSAEGQSSESGPKKYITETFFAKE